MLVPKAAVYIGYPLLKGVLVATTVVAVVRSSLTPFAQALVIALVSACIGALGLIVSALITRSESRRAQELAKLSLAHLEDLKAAGGIQRRRTESTEPPCP